uniref:Uncharacterized protein n=1 Tax=Rhizophora mucronata TaxID=61149 RepID=A0A2P2QD22_RHIMU
MIPCYSFNLNFLL